MKTKIKKNLTFGVMIVLALSLVSAGVVTYYSQKQIDMKIESPIIFNGDLLENVQLIAGEGYKLYLVEGENKLDRDVDVNFRFSLLDGEGDELDDTEGFNLAYSGDIEYSYNELYGNAADWTEAKTWMFSNLDWFDWYLTGDLEDYDASVITNHGENSAFSNVLDFNVDLPEDLSPGKFYAVVYLDVNEAVTPGDYTLSVDLKPTA